MGREDMLVVELTYLAQPKGWCVTVTLPDLRFEPPFEDSITYGFSAW